MKIEDSFAMGVVEVSKTYPVLAEPLQAKVTLKVLQIYQIAKEFHRRGWAESDPLGAFKEMIGL